MLNSHSEISVAPESLFVMNLARRYREKRFRDINSDRFVADLFLEARFKSWKLTPGDLSKHLMTACPPDAGYAEICAEVYAREAALNGKSKACVLGDKNPHYSLFARELNEIFPGAKFVHLVRDYRSNIASYREVNFDSNNVGVLARRWAIYNERIRENAIGFRERYILIKYEDLVLRTEPTLREICEFVGLKYDKSMIAYAEDSGQRKAVPWHGNLSRNPDPEILEKWRNKLGDQELAIAGAICKDTARRLGYSVEMDPRRGSVLAIFWGWLAGRIYVGLERFAFRLPLWMQTSLIHGYRRLTGTL